MVTRDSNERDLMRDKLFHLLALRMEGPVTRTWEQAPVYRELVLKCEYQSYSCKDKNFAISQWTWKSSSRPGWELSPLPTVNQIKSKEFSPTMPQQTRQNNEFVLLNTALSVAISYAVTGNEYWLKWCVSLLSKLHYIAHLTAEAGNCRLSYFVGRWGGNKLVSM